MGNAPRPQPSAPQTVTVAERMGPPGSSSGVLEMHKGTQSDRGGGSPWMEGVRRRMSDSETWGGDETGVLECSQWTRTLRSCDCSPGGPPGSTGSHPVGSGRLLWECHSAPPPATRACSAGSPGGLGGGEGGFARPA